MCALSLGDLVCSVNTRLYAYRLHVHALTGIAVQVRSVQMPVPNRAPTRRRRFAALKSLRNMWPEDSRQALSLFWVLS